MNIDAILEKDRREIARAISEIENNKGIPSELLIKTGKAMVVGVTGVPGSGKSTLISKLARSFADEGKFVAILAVDPSSPFSGGSILGDRIRMHELNKYENIYIRSVSSRGKIGGVSYFTPDMVNLLDAAGYDIIFVETVGTGQDEVDIYNLAHTILVLLVPNLGDEVQVIKAGQLEIGDIFVINKADTGPADEKVKEMLLIMKERENGWYPKVLKSIAIKNIGIKEIHDAVMDHWNFLKEKNVIHIKNRERLKYTIRQHIFGVMETMLKENDIDDYIESVLSGESIEEVVKRIMVKMGEEYGKGGKV